MQKTTMIKTF